MFGWPTWFFSTASSIARALIEPGSLHCSEWLPSDNFIAFLVFNFLVVDGLSLPALVLAKDTSRFSKLLTLTSESNSLFVFLNEVCFRRVSLLELQPRILCLYKQFFARQK